MRAKIWNKGQGSLKRFTTTEELKSWPFLMLAIVTVSQNRHRTAMRPWEFYPGTSVIVAYTNDGHLRDAY